MAAISSLPSSTPNRRKRVRHRVQTPAYASFTTEPKGTMLDLHEIVDISEEGMSIQCHSPLEIERRLDLCLDLAECPDHIYTTGKVIWSNTSGRAGIHFVELPADSLGRLREWLFVNVMAGVANGEAGNVASLDLNPPRPSYTDMLAAVTAMQRQVEALGPELNASLRLIADGSHALLRASGAAIALAEDDPNFMVCHASSGVDAPPVGARLQVGEGFSGECVKSGMLLRCDDTEVDARVDQASCRALGIRSILAAPVRFSGKSLGLIEAFSAQPNAFSQADGRVLQRLADTILAAINRGGTAEAESHDAPETDHPSAAPGSVLFASLEEDESDAEEKSNAEANQKNSAEEKSSNGISPPRSHLIILICAAATIAMALGYRLTPWMQSEVAPWVLNKIHARERALPTVLASPRAPRPDNAAASNSAVETATLEQLRQMAEKGDPVAENALGLRYATGDGVRLNESDAVRWFIRAAEQGYVPAQSKLGSIYYSGRGVPQDYNRAYFWMAVARMSGDNASKTLSPFVRARLTRAQVTAIELEADRWLQQHATSSTTTAQTRFQH